MKVVLKCLYGRVGERRGDDQRLIYNVQEREEKDFRRKKKSLSKGQSFISGSNGPKISSRQDGEKLYSYKRFIPKF